MLMPAWRLAVAGLIALAVAIGIGRFAFTPLLPMMLADGVLDLPTASWLASANYFGYLVGALLCTFQPQIWSRLGGPAPPKPPAMVRLGLVATVLLTLGMVLHLPAAWPLLRFAAGVASAFVFVHTSGWCLSQLSQRGVPAMGAVIYTGPGVGIVLSGLAASGMVALQWPAAHAWLIFGMLAAVLTALVWPVFDLRHETKSSAAAALAASPPTLVEQDRSGIGLLTLAYGLAGFGYIITATFLPVIARQALPGSHWLDLFWPIFGLGVVLGALGASRVPATVNRLAMLPACYLVQAAGVAASLVSPTLAGFAIGSLLLGLPFTAITFFALQEVRGLRPDQAASAIGLLTAVYGIGQIVGPPVAAAMLAISATPGLGFIRALELAAAALVVGALLFVWMARSRVASSNATRP